MRTEDLIMLIREQPDGEAWLSRYQDRMAAAGRRLTENHNRTLRWFLRLSVRFGVDRQHIDGELRYVLKFCRDYLDTLSTPSSWTDHWSGRLYADEYASYLEAKYSQWSFTMESPDWANIPKDVRNELWDEIRWLMCQSEDLRCQGRRSLWLLHSDLCRRKAA
jgi:hypothetical protein